MKAIKDTISIVDSLCRECISNSSYSGMREEVSFNLVMYIKNQIEDKIDTNDIRYNISKDLIINTSYKIESNM